jgi:hypothetical protein
MGIVLHAAAVAPLISAFFLVKLTVGGCWKLAEVRHRASVSNQNVCKFFL